MTEQQENKEHGDSGRVNEQTMENKPISSKLTENYNSDDFDTDLEEHECDFQDEATARMKKDAELQKTESSARYLKMCRSVEAVPCSKFIHQINQSEVSMRHYGLGPSGAKAIALEMLWNRNITKLDLTNTLLGDRGGMFIADMLLHNQHLRELNLADNNIGAKTMKALSDSMLINKSLVSLNLSSNGLNDKLTTEFLTALKKNTSLKELDMSFNKLSDQAGLKFGSFLAVNKSLEILKLRWNSIRLEGGVSLGKELRKNKVLRVLDLSNNGLDDESADTLGNSLKFNSTLLELNISNNRLTGIGLGCISKGIQINQSLRILKCGNNPVALSRGQENLTSLISSIKLNKSSALREIHLDEVYPNKEFQEALQDLLLSNATLKVFSGHQKMNSKMGMFLSVKKEKPWARLVEFIIQQNLNVSDLFRMFGSTNGVSINKEIFRKGLQTLGILQDQQTELLIEALQGEGEDLDYYDLIRLVDSYKKYLSKNNMMQSLYNKETNKAAEKDSCEETD